MLDLNDHDDEMRGIVDAIRRNLATFIQQYDSQKYPEDVYQRLRIAFCSPQFVTAHDIWDALVWK